MKLSFSQKAFVATCSALFWGTVLAPVGFAALVAYIAYHFIHKHW